MIKILSNIINTIMVVYFFNNIMPPKDKRKSTLYTIFMIIFYVLISSNIINNIMAYNFHKNKILSFVLTYYISVLIYPLFFRRGRQVEKFFWSSFYITIMLVSFLMIYIITLKLWNL